MGAGRRVSAAAVVILMLAAPAWAQTGRVGGQVKDEAGNAIKGATVTAENPNHSKVVLIQGRH